MVKKPSMIECFVALPSPGPFSPGDEGGSAELREMRRIASGSLQPHRGPRGGAVDAKPGAEGRTGAVGSRGDEPRVEVVAPNGFHEISSSIL